jgi:hypothetical protein
VGRPHLHARQRARLPGRPLAQHAHVGVGGQRGGEAQRPARRRRRRRQQRPKRLQLQVEHALQVSVRGGVAGARGQRARAPLGHQRVQVAHRALGVARRRVGAGLRGGGVVPGAGGAPAQLRRRRQQRTPPLRHLRPHQLHLMLGRPGGGRGARHEARQQRRRAPRHLLRPVQRHGRQQPPRGLPGGPRPRRHLGRVVGSPLAQLHLPGPSDRCQVGGDAAPRGRRHARRLQRAQRALQEGGRRGGLHLLAPQHQRYQQPPPQLAALGGERRRGPPQHARHLLRQHEEVAGAHHLEQQAVPHLERLRVGEGAHGRGHGGRRGARRRRRGGRGGGRRGLVAPEGVARVEHGLEAGGAQVEPGHELFALLGLWVDCGEEQGERVRGRHRGAAARAQRVAAVGGGHVGPVGQRGLVQGGGLRQGGGSAGGHRVRGARPQQRLHEQRVHRPRQRATAVVARQAHQEA